MVYLDNNATTPLDPRVAEAMARFLRDHFGNPSSLYPLGRECRDMMTDAREVVAGALGAHRSEVVFTASGTEADNFAVFGVMEAHPEKDEFITSAIEHPAILESAKFLEKKGFKVTYLPVDETGVVS
ncbi:MAG: aminotransferase class V-fold PLP-dependent enzyme, partial [Candidatus Aminicenantes bacterium]|nr:aminotransferase class V-fold PLP-dependent enzyme [Candidatus Aminicenantes bacterium]